MSLFRIFKYSSMLFFLGKYKQKLFRVVAVLLFALVTSLLYQDVANYLQEQYPESVIYALAGKIIIVYGALVFVLLQFRPSAEDRSDKAAKPPPTHRGADDTPNQPQPQSPLAALEDVNQKNKLKTRYEGVLEKKPKQEHPSNTL